MQEHDEDLTFLCFPVSHGFEILGWQAAFCLFSVDETVFKQNAGFAWHNNSLKGLLFLNSEGQEFSVVEKFRHLASKEYFVGNSNSPLCCQHVLVPVCQQNLV